MHEIFTIFPGQSVRFVVPMSVLGSAPVTLPVSVTLTVRCLEEGAPDPEIVDANPVYDGSTPLAATYHSDQVLPSNSTPGRWSRRWQATGPSPSQCAVAQDEFYVAALDF